MKKLIAVILATICVIGLIGCGQQHISEEKSLWTYEELSEMPKEELLDLFIQNGLIINDELSTAFTEEELETLFKENFDM